MLEFHVLSCRGELNSRQVHLAELEEQRERVEQKMKQGDGGSNMCVRWLGGRAAHNITKEVANWGVMSGMYITRSG